MKALFTAVVYVLLSAPLWAAGYSITVETNNSNPLDATGYTSPEPTADLNGIQVIFGFSNYGDDESFNSSGRATDSSGAIVITAPSGTTNGTWSIWDNATLGMGPTLNDITFVNASTAGGTGFFADASCNGASDLCGVPVTASYSGPFEINGVMPTDPGYSELTFTFDDGFYPGDQFDFSMSSEYVDGPITPATSSSTTPEPASLFLLVGGLCTLGGVARFRRSHKSS